MPKGYGYFTGTMNVMKLRTDALNEQSADLAVRFNKGRLDGDVGGHLWIMLNTARQPSIGTVDAIGEMQLVVVGCILRCIGR